MKYSLFLLLVIVLLASCTNPCSENLHNLGTSFYTIELFDVTKNDYFYNENPNKALYNRDSLKIFDDKGNQYSYIQFKAKSDPRQPVNIIYSINFGPAFFIPEDNDAFNTEKNKKLYLHYNYNTSDTLNFIYKATYNECHTSIWDYYTVYHRGKIIATTSGFHFVEIKLNH